MNPGRGRRVAATSTALLLALALGACGQEPLADLPDRLSFVEPSELYLQTVGAETAREQTADLATAVQALRDATGTGWNGRQDDVTGYLGELSGGRVRPEGSGDTAGSVVTAFLDSSGPALFGVGTDLGEVPDEPTSILEQTQFVQVDQSLRGVPVLEGRLVFQLTGSGDSLRLNSVRGRAYPGLDVATDPTISAEDATDAAEDLSGGSVEGAPVLVVDPDGAGTLAWQVTVLGAERTVTDSPASEYLISAVDGTLVRSFESSHSAALASAADPDTVPVSGKDSYGATLKGFGLQGGAGVSLVDRSAATYTGNGRGEILTFTMGGSDDETKLPGSQYVEAPGNGATITDPDAIAAHSASRAVIDYYVSMGRNSWDGKGGSLRSAVNFGDGSYCNAFFTPRLGLMVYGNPCEGPGGASHVTSIDTAGHEITHGVIGTSSNLRYASQSGALNESFADYFGNVIANRVKKTDDSRIGEDDCAQVKGENRLCDLTAADGSQYLREMLNGSKYSDYLRMVEFSYGFSEVAQNNNDNGGVHINSAIWNNALWSIRSQLSKIDGKDGNTSPRAQQFDRIVLHTLTTQLTPTSNMLDARRGIEASITAAGGDPVIMRVAREVFELNDFCESCLDVGKVTGKRLTPTMTSEFNVFASGDRTGWIAGNIGGRVTGSTGGGASKALTSVSSSISAAFAGDAVIEQPDEIPTPIVRTGPDGRVTVLAKNSDELVGVQGSREGAVWIDRKAGTMSFVDPAGKVTVGRLPAGDDITAIAAGGGSVGLGSRSGRLYLWKPGGGPTDFSQIGQVPGTVVGLAVHGERILGIDRTGNGAIYQVGDRDPIVLPKETRALGAALNTDYAVWTTRAGAQDTAVAKASNTSVSDLDLRLYSFATGKTYDLVKQKGQQAFPVLSGNRLSWLDAVFANTDVMTETLPPGL